MDFYTFLGTITDLSNSISDMKRPLSGCFYFQYITIEIGHHSRDGILSCPDPSVYIGSFKMSVRSFKAGSQISPSIQNGRMFMFMVIWFYIRCKLKVDFHFSRFYLNCFGIWAKKGNDRLSTIGDIC